MALTYATDVMSRSAKPLMLRSPPVEQGHAARASMPHDYRDLVSNG